MSRDISLLHPKLRQIIPQIIQRCAERGLPVLVTDGFRSKAEQDAIYAKGRTAPGQIVTQVRWPNSAHNWGVAIDFCRNVRGREYDDGDGFFRRVAEIAKQYGLEWGGDWTRFVDKPHLQLREFMPGNSTAWLRQTYGTPEKFQTTWKAEPDTGFIDVPASAWYAEDVAWAAERGLMSGYDDGRFGVGDPVTREQLAAVLHRLEK